MIIYKVTNLTNGKIYIGKTITKLSNRKARHYASVKRGSETNFHRALRLYSPEYFKWEILIEANTEEELNTYEIKYIEEFNSYKNGYNMTTGGNGGVTIRKGDLLYERVKHKFSNWKNGNPGATKEAIKKRIETFKTVKWVSGIEHGNYGRSRLDIKGKPPHNARPVIIDGIEYASTGIAAREIGLKDGEVVRLRCISKSKKWKNYCYK